MGIQVNVALFTPIEEAKKPWMNWFASYLSPLFGTREVAVLTTPVINVDGSRSCLKKEFETNFFKTFIKVATYVASLGTFIFFAILCNIALRINNKFHYLEEAPRPLLLPLPLPPPPLIEPPRVVLPMINPIREPNDEAKIGARVLELIDAQIGLPDLIEAHAQLPAGIEKTAQAQVIARLSQGVVPAPRPNPPVQLNRVIQPNRVVLPIVRPPPSIGVLQRSQVVGIPIRPTAFPTFEEPETEECPVAPMLVGGPVNPQKTAELIRWINQQIREEAHWERSYEGGEIAVPVRYRHTFLWNSLRDNANCLTQEDWIEILNEIPVEPDRAHVVQIGDGLALHKADIQDTFERDREIVVKQRLALLAREWVVAIARGRPDDRDMSPEHPFHSMYQALGSGSGQTNQTLIAFQELIRFLPLIKAFAAQKKDILVEGLAIQTKRFSVNYLLDSVLRTSVDLTGLIIHNGFGLQRFARKGGGAAVQIPLQELDSDKIVTAANTVWNAYLRAKENDDMPAFFQAFNGYCFDARMSNLNSYIQKFALHPDFMLNTTKLNKDALHRAGEYYEKFMNEQCVIFGGRQEPPLEYQAFKEKMLGERRGSDEAKADPQAIEFFRDYASEGRFNTWAQAILRDNVDTFGRSMYPAITNAAWGGRDLWGEAIFNLKEVLVVDFEP